ncbi:MAG TPA: nucleotidyltransferase family protein [Gemmatimonadales bacterium]|nr:nucleotidyltransferase family protein [Gemmatimonadales bacterium]
MISSGLRSSRPLPALTLEAALPQQVSEPPSRDGLLEKLARALDGAGIRYCQWKGHWSAHRWSRGYGDVDLLIDHAAVNEFRNIAGELGFKLAHPGGERQLPGVEHYFGLDPEVPRLLHLHVHYRLLLGEYWKCVYRLPIERQILEQSVPGQPFRVPSPTHTFLIFVLRMMLRQVGRPLLSARARWLGGIQVPLASLQAASDATALGKLLEQHLPQIDIPFFEACVRSLDGRSSWADRILLPWQLHLKLRAYVRRPPAAALVSALLERVLPASIADYLTDACMRPSGGGVVVALIGGDGSGKSTCARELHQWLAPELSVMRAHLGNPSRSLLTLVAGAALKLEQAVYSQVGRSPAGVSRLELLRHVCTARDRYRLYQKAWRFAAAGGIAVCERYPVRPGYVHVAPVIPELISAQSGGLAGLLRKLEASYYGGILPPDLVFVLSIDPELAVQRKPEEPADYVRARSRVIRETDWAATGAVIVDASRPLPEVLQQLKTAIWSTL